jgi:2-amino-4-hydroxy-6-hydroxymethyldihydropteridine diphosphokinase
MICPPPVIPCKKFCMWHASMRPMQVERHSALYETVPAYVSDQPNFYNAAVLARTRLRPLQLLDTLKAVEASAGRDLQGGVRFGPRPLDLDIIFYGQHGLKDDRLEVPHPRSAAPHLSNSVRLPIIPPASM